MTEQCKTVLSIFAFRDEITELRYCIAGRVALVTPAPINSLASEKLETNSRLEHDTSIN